MSDRQIGRRRSLEVKITPINLGMPGGLLEAILRAEKSPICGVCINGTAPSSGASNCAAELRSFEARARVYICGRVLLMGDPHVEPAVQGNFLHEFLVLLREVLGLAMGFPPEAILWAPGIYGPDVERKALGFKLRPLAPQELAHPEIREIVYRIGEKSKVNTRQSESGYWCVDRSRLPEIRSRLVTLLENPIIRYADPSGDAYQIPRVCDPAISALMDSLRGMSLEEFCQSLSPEMPDPLTGVLQSLEVSRAEIERLRSIASMSMRV